MNAPQPQQNKAVLEKALLKLLGVRDLNVSHYRFFGLDDFESDPDVIDSSADKLMAHLKTHAVGELSTLAQQLLNQASQRKLILLDPAKRAAYDARLRASTAPQQQAPIPAAPAAPLPPPPMPSAPLHGSPLHGPMQHGPPMPAAPLHGEPAAQIAPDFPAMNDEYQPRSSGGSGKWIVVGGLATLAVVAAVVLNFPTGGDPGPVVPPPGETAVAPPVDPIVEQRKTQQREQALALMTQAQTLADSAKTLAEQQAPVEAAAKYQEALAKLAEALPLFEAAGDPPALAAAQQRQTLWTNEAQTLSQYAAAMLAQREAEQARMVVKEKALADGRTKEAEAMQLLQAQAWDQALARLEAARSDYTQAEDAEAMERVGDLIVQTRAPLFLAQVESAKQQIHQILESRLDQAKVNRVHLRELVGELLQNLDAAKPNEAAASVLVALETASQAGDLQESARALQEWDRVGREARLIPPEFREAQRTKALGLLLAAAQTRPEKLAVAGMMAEEQRMQTVLSIISDEAQAAARKGDLDAMKTAFEEIAFHSFPEEAVAPVLSQTAVASVAALAELTQTADRTQLAFRLPPFRSKAVEASLNLLPLTFHGDDFTNAQDIVRHAVTMADKPARLIPKDYKPLLDRLESTEKDVRAQAATLDGLKQTPDDPALNLARAQQLAQRDSWDQAKLHLAKSSASSLSDLLDSVSLASDAGALLAVAGDLLAESEKPEYAAFKPYLQGESLACYQAVLASQPTSLQQLAASSKIRDLERQRVKAVTSAVPSSSPGAGKLGKVVNMLQNYNLNANIVVGNWEIANGGIQGGANNKTSPRIALPFNVTGGYIVQFDFVRHSNPQQVNFFFPVFDRLKKLEVSGFDGESHNLDPINGKRLPVQAKPLSNGVKHRVEIKVTYADDKATVVTSLDGQIIHDATMTREEASRGIKWSLAPSTASFAFGSLSPATLYSALLRTIGDDSTIQPAVPGGSSTAPSPGSASLTPPPSIPAVPSRPGSIKLGKPVNMLQGFDLKSNIVAGKWEISNGGIRNEEKVDANPRIALPYVASGGYIAQFEFVRHSGGDAVAFDFPLFKNQKLVFIVSGQLGKVHGMWKVRGERLNVPAKPLTNGVKYRAEIKVTYVGAQASVVTSLNGQVFYDLKLTANDLDPPSDDASPVLFGYGGISPSSLFSAVVHPIDDSTIQPASPGASSTAPSSGSASLNPTPSNPARPAFPGSEKLGKPVNMLQGFDLKANTVVGDWKISNGGIQGGANNNTNPRIVLPFLVTGGYVAQFDFARHSGSDPVMFLFPVFDKKKGFMVSASGGDFHTLNSVRGKELSVPAEPVANGVKHRVEIKVTYVGEEATVVTSLDGKVIYNEMLFPKEKIHQGQWSLDPSPALFGYGSIAPSSLYSALIQTIGDDSVLQPAVPGASSTAPSLGSIKLGKPVDMLQNFDLKANIVDGKWEISDGALRNGEKAEADPCIKLPYVASGGYIAQLEFVRHSGQNPVMVSFPLFHTKRLGFMVGGQIGAVHYMSIVRGQKLTVPAKPISNGDKHRVEIKVTYVESQATVVASLDGQVIYNLNLTADDIGLSSGDSPRPSTTRPATFTYLSGSPSSLLSAVVHPIDDGTIKPAVPGAASSTPSPGSASLNPPPAVTALPGSEKLGKAVNMLQNYNLKANIVKGDWEISNGGIRGGANDNSNPRIALPYVVTGGYIAQFEFVRHSSQHPVKFIFPVFEKKISFSVSGWGGDFHYLSPVRGKQLSVPAKPVSNGEKHRVEIKVTYVEAQAAIVASLDGQTIYNESMTADEVTEHINSSLAPSTASFGYNSVCPSTLYSAVVHPIGDAAIKPASP